MEAIKTKKPSKLYTIREAAKETNIPEPALRGWIKAGKIRSIKSGNRAYFTLEALDAFIDGTEAAR